MYTLYEVKLILASGLVTGFVLGITFSIFAQNRRK
ncbi:hypothetical protein PHIM7_294 [Sinorhizobium phage phiM7]|uniref:Transmembrane protein n=1 Tax=Sinorhizobium phage phiM7 TaxID=1647403 RepID=A0A0F6WBR7_9CAUD|nr:hypothetical protein FDH46_gp184 [Sinorhizobium phage phiM7]AKF12840.1 hypothetical protein PHIM7_294 [Sinorhizobium phage phiM7]AKF13199.1 hypothetical protein PHIM19_294 [Sinorhizobium phage phiM19]